MMIMRRCTVETNEYDLQAKMYPNICTHHKLHNNYENKFPVFPERICFVIDLSTSVCNYNIYTVAERNFCVAGICFSL